MNRRMSKKRLKKEFLILLEKAPIIQSARLKLNVAHSTIYRWIKEDTPFAQEIDEAIAKGKSAVNDLAESKLITGINSGDFRYIKYWLSHNKKEVYGTIVQVVEKSPEKISLSDEEIAEMDAFIEKVLEKEHQLIYPFHLQSDIIITKDYSVITNK